MNGVDGAKYVKAVTFLYEPNWFTSFVVMNQEYKKLWLGTLKDQWSTFYLEVLIAIGRLFWTDFVIYSNSNCKICFMSAN